TSHLNLSSLQKYKSLKESGRAVALARPRLEVMRSSAREEGPGRHKENSPRLTMTRYRPSNETAQEPLRQHRPRPGVARLVCRKLDAPLRAHAAAEKGTPGHLA